MYHITILEPPHNLHNLHNLARLNAMSSFTLASSAPSKTIARAHARRGAARGARVVVHAAKKKQDATEEDEAKIDFKGLKQLISMGLGTISGDITEVNLDDPTRAVGMELGASRRSPSPRAARRLDMFLGARRYPGRLTMRLRARRRRGE